MKPIFLICSLFLISFFAKSQELNAKVIVNYDQVNASNVTMFKDLEKDLSNFINTTKWTQEVYQNHEKIECTFLLIVKEISGNTYKSTLQVQARRPIYGSIYFSPTVNLQDDKISFNHAQNQQLLFNIRNFSRNNLPEIIAYYVYLILGYDGDSFQLNGGTNFFQLANQTADLSFNQGYEGWEQDGGRNRKNIVSNILSNDLATIRKSWYKYHRLGLDNMMGNPKNGKKNIAEALTELGKLNLTFSNNFNVLDFFLLPKEEEIQQVFSQKDKEDSYDVKELKSALKKLSPTKRDKWDKLQ